MQAYLRSPNEENNMGWNSAFTILEEQVVNLHNADLLTYESLCAVISPFIDTDIDLGGSRWLVSRDGKECLELIAMTLDPAAYDKAMRIPVTEHCDDERADAINMTYYDVIRGRVPLAAYADRQRV